MKKEMIELCLYEKGDRVLTPSGMATVLEDEKLELDIHGNINRLSLAYNDVKVELDESCSGHADRQYEAETATFILEEERV